MFICIEQTGRELAFTCEPNINYRYKSFSPFVSNMFIGEMEKGSIMKIIGKEMIWDDDPVEVDESFLSSINIKFRNSDIFENGERFLYENI